MDLASQKTGTTSSSSDLFRRVACSFLKKWGSPAAVVRARTISTQRWVNQGFYHGYGCWQWHILFATRRKHQLLIFAINIPKYWLYDEIDYYCWLYIPIIIPIDIVYPYDSFGFSTLNASHGSILEGWRIRKGPSPVPSPGRPKLKRWASAPMIETIYVELNAGVTSACTTCTAAGQWRHDVPLCDDVPALEGLQQPESAASLESLASWKMLNHIVSQEQSNPLQRWVSSACKSIGNEGFLQTLRRALPTTKTGAEWQLWITSAWRRRAEYGSGPEMEVVLPSLRKESHSGRGSWRLPAWDHNDSGTLERHGGPVQLAPPGMPPMEVRAQALAAAQLLGLSVIYRRHKKR